MTLFSRTFHVAALVTGLGLVPTLVAAKPASPTAKAQRATIAAAYGQLPLAFEANHGQHPQPVDFLARGPNYTLWLTPTEAVFSLRNATTDTPTTVRMQLVDSNPSAVARGERKLPGIVNHAIGSDATKWRTASTFAEVRYDDVYPGIDVVYYGKQRQLEYDFVVAPGSSPDRIALAFTGVDRMRIEADGSLVLTQPGGDLRWAPPVLYQRIGGTRRPVTGAYRIVEGKVGFAVGKYDRSRPLVIDPVLYSTFIGGSLNDRADAIVIDSENRPYITGYAYSVNYPTTTGPALAGSQDVVVSRLSANGSTLQMSTYIGGSAFETGTGIALDANNNIYVSGRTSSTNFPTTAGAYKVVKGASIDAFVTKLDTAGGIVYSTFIGGDGNDEAHDIAVDGLNRAYITGQTEGGTYPILGAFDPTYNGGAWDAFVTRLTANGAALSYSSYLGGSGYDYGYGIAVSANEAYVTGYTTSSNFTCVAGAYDTTYNGAGDAFVTRVAANGASLVASTFVGGTDTDSGEDIALGGQGHVFITGWAASPNYPTTLGASDTSHNGGTDVIVTKLNGALASLTYSTFAGGSSNDYGYGIAINSAGGAAATGLTSSTDFPVVIPTQAAFGGGVNDAFVLRVVPTGASLNFSTYLGGGGYEYARAVALDSAGLPIVTGVASDALFPTVPGSYDVTHNGVWDVFVTKLQP